MLKQILVAALTIGVAAPAAAQTPIEVPANAGWKHAQTGVVLRSKLAGQARTGISDSSANELDVMIRYDGDAHNPITLYVFRPAGGGLPIWFDRAETQIRLRDSLGGAAPAGPTVAFARPKATAQSSLRRVFLPGKGPYKATGVAMMPLGEWLIAVRFSSADLDAAGLDARMTEIIAGIGWPDGVAESPAAAPVPACSGQLAYARGAKLNKPDMADALIGAMVGGIAAEKAEKSPEQGRPITWCREGEGEARFGVYRDAASVDSYMMALGDAGRVVNVNRGFGLDDKQNFMLTLGDLDRTLVYPSFNKLPRPEAAFQAVTKTAPISSSSRDGKDITIGVGE